MSYHVLKTDIVAPEANEIYPQVASLADGVFWLDPETGLTDMLTQASTSTPGLLVSERLYRLLAEHRVPGSLEARPVVVRHHDETYPYFWLPVTDDLERHVDYPASEFELVKSPVEPPERVKLRDYDDFLATRKKLVDTVGGDLRARRLVLLPDTPAKDLLYLRLTSPVYFASRELADNLVAAGLTGLEVVPHEAEVVLK
jgi:hypothetical protein